MRLVPMTVLVGTLVLSACERPRPKQSARNRYESYGASVPVPSQTRYSDPEPLSPRSSRSAFRLPECNIPRSKMSAYSYALAEAIGEWGLHNQPLLRQFRNTPWHEIPETAQVQVARRIRQGLREEAVKRAIANGSPASSMVCKPESPNCFNAAGNLDLVGDYYLLIVHDQNVEIGKAAANVARGQALDVAEQWSRIERLDQRLYDFSAILPASAVLAEFQYPVDPPDVATCHQARKQQQPERRVCTDPQTEAERRAASAAMPPTPFSVEVRDLGDLDDDGRNEFAVDSSSRTALSTTVLGTDSNGCAHEIVTDGGGVVHRVLRSRTRGWKDLEMGVPVNRSAGEANACWVTLRATFDGKKYRITNVLRVEPFDGEESVADLRECRKHAEHLIQK